MNLAVRILTSADAGGPAVVLRGELDLAAADGVTAALDQVAAERPDRVVVDAEGVTFCGSSGLRSLLAAPGPNPVVLRSGPTGRRSPSTSPQERTRSGWSATCATPL